MPRVTPRTSASYHGIERVDWEELGPALLSEWGRRGGRIDPEHLTVYGPSGSGKSTMLGHLANERARLYGSHVVFVATKPADETVKSFGWPITSSWPPGYGETCVVYWARAKGISRAHRVPQAIAVRRLMDALWVKGSNRVVVWDELPYLEGDLGLKTEIATFYREGRALGITNMTSMQRPSGTTRLAHSEPVIAVAFKPADQDDADRVAEVLGHRQLYREVLMDLDRSEREFVIKDRYSGEAYISRLRRRSAARTAVR